MCIHSYDNGYPSQPNLPWTSPSPGQPPLAGSNATRAFHERKGKKKPNLAVETRATVNANETVGKPWGNHGENHGKSRIY